MESISVIMSGCMQAGKPLISILMAVYEPRLNWLREQLESLEAQTYPNLRLYIRDDCSPTVPFKEIEECVRSCIQSFPYEIKRNEKNLGSNLTFERLTEEAEGEYFAYCDQDDIWLPEKLVVLQEEMAKSGALLACSDMLIIDGEGKQTADSITKIRRHHRFCSGEGLAEGLLVHNFVTGCTMLVRGEAAKAAVPFCPYMVHDHYIALWCAERGAVLSVQKPLIRYRVHNNNQTNLLAGVTDKRSYALVRISGMKDRLVWLEENFSSGERLGRAIKDGLIWAQAREDNWQHCGGKAQIWKYRRYSPLPSVFELFAAEMPESVFRIFLRAAKKNLV